MSPTSRFRRSPLISPHSRSGFFSAASARRPSSVISACWSTIAATANASAATNAYRTPCSTPHTAMNVPPITGPSIFGARRTSDCTDTLIVRLFFGTTCAINSIVAGNDNADHEMKNAAPTSTAHQVRTKITIKYPTTETRLKTSNARLWPRWSDR